MADLLAIEAEASSIAFFAALALVAAWEWFAPRRALVQPLQARWIANMAVAVIDTLALRLLLPVAGVAFAALVAEHGFGLFSRIEAPIWLATVVTLLVLDLGRYAVHRMLHAVPFLWRLHGMHHTDGDYDVTTGLRFHPFESVLTGAIKLALIAALGAPPIAVLIAMTAITVSSILAHANAGLAPSIDGAIRRVLVTPDMHRVHHSADRRESASNYGSLFSFWDPLFDTYRAEPALSHANMRIGLDGFGGPRHQLLAWMLAFPFRRPDQPAISPPAARRGRARETGGAAGSRSPEE
ncbi:MAG: sterol desaturase family protein [Alphaproteobacteria bacterium]|nr:sterol desaturase family protein [Alphaproteobacteria bacterium]